jgi:hypothetical protein
MRAAAIVIVALATAFLIAHSMATADTCNDACDRAYATCAKSCPSANNTAGTDCFTKCLTEKNACVMKCQ